MAFIETILLACGVWSVPLGILIQFIPNELVLAYGGYLVNAHDTSFFLMFMLAWSAFTLSQVLFYGIGRYGGRPVALKLYQVLRIKSDKQLQAERWFERYGTWIVCLSVLWRHLFAISAGVMRLSFRKFLFATTAAFAVWSLIFIQIGFLLGDNWRHIGHYTHRFMPFLIIGIVIVVTVRYVKNHPKFANKSA